MENRRPEGPEELPQGLLQRMGHSTRAMENFFSLSRAQQQALLSNIEASSTGDEAKSRIEQTLSALESGDIDRFRSI